MTSYQSHRHRQEQKLSGEEKLRLFVQGSRMVELQFQDNKGSPPWRQISLKSLQLRSGTCQKEARCTAAFPSWYTLLRSLKHLVCPEEAACLFFVISNWSFEGQCLVLLFIMISQGNTCLPACQESSATEAREKDPPWSPIFTWRNPSRFGEGNDLVRAREWKCHVRGTDR